MIKDQSNIDLSTLADRFVEHGDYTKEVILEELTYWQANTDFLVVTSGEAFLIGHRSRNSFFIAQVHSDEGLMVGREALRYAKKWARDKGLTSMTFETTRKEMQAMLRYGFTESSVLMECKIC